MRDDLNTLFILHARTSCFAFGMDGVKGRERGERLVAIRGYAELSVSVVELGTELSSAKGALFLGGRGGEKA